MPADDTTWKHFAEKLDQHHTWPASYTFKCVVPRDAAASAQAMLPPGTYSTRPSSGGKYTALTCIFHAEDSSRVIEVYQRLSVIEGIILL